MITSNLFKEKNFLIFGLGISGIASVKSLLESGATVYAFDEKLLPIENGNSDKALERIFNFKVFKNSNFHYVRDLNDIPWKKLEYAVISPGIPSVNKNYKKIITNLETFKVISDIDLLKMAMPNKFFIGVTGTNGKSTVVSMVYHIMKKHNLKS